MPDLTVDWTNIARCAHDRYKSLYEETMETGERKLYGLSSLVIWGSLNDRAVRELETCLMARLMADIQLQRSNA